MAEENRVAFCSLVLSNNFSLIIDNLFQVSSSQILTLELMRKVIIVKPELVITQNFFVSFINYLNRESSDFSEFYSFIRFFNEILDNYDMTVLLLISSDIFTRALGLLNQFEMIQLLIQVSNQKRHDLDLIYLSLAKLMNKLITLKSSKFFFNAYVIEMVNDDFFMSFNKFTQYFFTKRARLVFLERYYEPDIKDKTSIDNLLRVTWAVLDNIFSTNIHETRGLYHNMLIVRAIQLYDKCSNNISERLYNAYLRKTDKLTIRYKAEQLGEDMNWENIDVPFSSSFYNIRKEVS